MRLSKLQVNFERTEVVVPWFTIGTTREKEFSEWIAKLDSTEYSCRGIATTKADTTHQYDRIRYEFRDPVIAAEFAAKFSFVDEAALLSRNKWINVRVPINSPITALTAGPATRPHVEWLRTLPLDTWDYVGIGAEEYTVYQYYKMKNERDATEFALRFS
jgi:hypothetical protein